MQIIRPMRLVRRSSAAQTHVHNSTLSADHLVELSSWMMVLGTVRLVCAFADYAGSFLVQWRGDSLPFEIARTYTQDDQPIVGLCAAWPLLLALAVRRKRWPELLPAAAATFLILSIGGGVALGAESIQKRATEITIGSFHLATRAFKQPTISDVSLIVLGVIQLLAEFATAVRAVLLVPRFRGGTTAPSAKTDGARRARFGRLAVFASVGYLVLMMRLTLWSTYLEILDNSTNFREFVLGDDSSPGQPRNFVKLPKDQMELASTQMKLRMANRDLTFDRFAAARANYVHVIASADSQSGGALPAEYGFILAEALNSLAWLQATCPSPEFRNSGEAVRHARRAVEMNGREGAYWNTLGAAYYRNGDWKSAKDALSRSMALRNGGDGFDWLFVALVELKLGRKEKAREWYDKAAATFRQFGRGDRDLYRICVEAAHELGLPEPERGFRARPYAERTELAIPVGPTRSIRNRHSQRGDQIPDPGVARK